MVRRLSLVVSPAIIALCLIAIGSPSRAMTTYQAFLNSAQQVSANPSLGTGWGTVVLNDAMDQITVNESWSGLLAPVTASHIHTGALGVNGPVTFPFSGVPNATSGSIPEQVFAINATQLANLNAGHMYFNIHTDRYPGGEIRGQIGTVPEPGTAAMLLTAAPAALLMLRRRKNA